MRPKRIVITSFALAVVFVLSACSALTGETSAPPSSGNKLPLVKITALKLIDQVPLRIAIAKGFFKEEGIDIKVDTGAKGAENVTKVLSGEYQLGLTSYPPAITAHDKVGNMRVVIDAVQTKPYSVVLVVKKDSPIRTLKDLEGQKIATSSVKGISELAMNKAFRMHGVDPAKVKYVSIEIAGMPAAVQLGNVQAAMIAEPHVRLAYAEGTQPLYDVFSGPTKDFAWSGYVATAQWADANRETVLKIQRAMNRAAEVARKHREEVEQILIKELGIPEHLAPQTVVPEFPTSVDPVRLRRVVDLMRDNGETGKNNGLIDVDMKTMMMPAA